MKPNATLDLVRMVLDRQLVDSDYIECGIVDDLEMEIAEGELRVTAILTGPGQAARHLPGWLQRIAFRLFGRRVTRIPWEEIYLIEGRIKLRSRHDALGLNEIDRALSRWVAKLPRSR